MPVKLKYIKWKTVYFYSVKGIIQYEPEYMLNYQKIKMSQLLTEVIGGEALTSDHLSSDHLSSDHLTVKTKYWSYTREVCTFPGV